jgi:hypothetical protein
VRDLGSATEGVWTAERIRVFLSHTSSHRVAAGDLAKELHRIGFSCFVAHDSIEPSRQWQGVIEVALASCDALVAYVTPDFAASRWTDQEVGWALGRRVPVIPLRVGADPYGFFGAFQALTVRDGQSAWEVALNVTRAVAVAMFGQQVHPDMLNRLTDLIVESFCSSTSYESVRRRFEWLSLIPRGSWTNARLERLEVAMAQNSQIRDGVLQAPMQRPAPDAVVDLISRLRNDGSAL